MRYLAFIAGCYFLCFSTYDAFAKPFEDPVVLSSLKCESFNVAINGYKRQDYYDPTKAVQTIIPTTYEPFGYCLYFSIKPKEMLAVSISAIGSVNYEIALQDVVSGNIINMPQVGARGLKYHFITPVNSSRNVKLFIMVESGSYTQAYARFTYKFIDVDRAMESATAKYMRNGAFAHLLDCMQDNCAKGIAPSSGSMAFVNFLDSFFFQKKQLGEVFTETAISALLSSALEGVGMQLPAGVATQVAIEIKDEIFSLDLQD